MSKLTKWIRTEIESKFSHLLPKKNIKLQKKNWQRRRQYKFHRINQVERANNNMLQPATHEHTHQAETFFICFILIYFTINMLDSSISICFTCESRFKRDHPNTILCLNEIECENQIDPILLFPSCDHYLPNIIARRFFQKSFLLFTSCVREKMLFYFFCVLTYLLVRTT